MNKPLALLATLCGAIALPALAQMSPAQTNQDPRAARMETRNARGGQLTAVSSDQALANALRRCRYSSMPPGRLVRPPSPNSAHVVSQTRSTR